jgi:NAD+ kinase
MKIALHATTSHRIPQENILKIAEEISGAGHEILASNALLNSLDNPGIFGFRGEFSTGTEAAGIDFFLSLGGDGTLLESLLFTLRNKIPLLGINFGRLGFLPCISHEELGLLLLQLEKGKPALQERAVLELICESDLHPFPEFPFALNEIALIKKDSSSMIHIRTEVDGVFLNEYWGDGLIVATPTGSTGYSLSCGGPIIWPDSSALVLTPVSPHNLSMRPLVINDGMEISLVPAGRSPEIMLSMDSRSESFPVGQKLRIRCSREKAIFYSPEADSFPARLREKLFWGKDYRN